MASIKDAANVQVNTCSYILALLTRKQHMCSIAPLVENNALLNYIIGHRDNRLSMTKERHENTDFYAQGWSST